MAIRPGDPGDPDAIIAALEQRLAKITNELNELLALGAFFQDDHAKKFPVIVAFRRWRSGAITAEEFLARLGEDDLADVLRHEPVPPMKGLAILNDHRQAQR